MTVPGDIIAIACAVVSLCLVLLALYREPRE